MKEQGKDSLEEGVDFSWRGDEGRVGGPGGVGEEEEVALEEGVGFEEGVPEAGDAGGACDEVERGEVEEYLGEDFGDLEGGRGGGGLCCHGGVWN